jgi:ankyrin repeat protein
MLGDVNEVDERGWTALIHAAYYGRTDEVRLLLAHQDIDVNKAIASGAAALIAASQNGHAEVVRLLLARQDVEVNNATENGTTALYVASQNGHVEVVRLLLARQGVEVNKITQLGVTALMNASRNGHVEPVRLLLAHPDVEADRTSTDGRSAICLASKNGHAAIVSLLVAHRAHGQVQRLAADAIDSLPADLIKGIPGYAAQVAALCLPLDVAAALGDTEEERAAGNALASQSALLEEANAKLAAVSTPEKFSRAREAIANDVQTPSEAAREREADAALRAAMTTTEFRSAQARQLIVRKILFSRSDALVRGAGISDAFAQLFITQMLEEFKLAQAESAVRFALRHNGQNRLLGATRALETAITARSVI